MPIFKSWYPTPPHQNHPSHQPLHAQPSYSKENRVLAKSNPKEA